MADKNMLEVKNVRWLGIALIVLGVIAILTPVIAGSAVVIVIGVVMLAAGISQIARGLGAPAWSEKILTTTLGVISVIAGLLVLGHPILGLTFLTLLLVGYFLIEGVWKIVISFQYRPAAGWAGLLISGVLSFLLGWLIWKQWPVSGIWAVGILVGVNLLSTGIALMTLSSAANTLARSR
jgi:uncharacterized membrane protein HdeD (DUF308 family)